MVAKAAGLFAVLAATAGFAGGGRKGPESKLSAKVIMARAASRTFAD
jgi:hypothetical protein